MGQKHATMERRFNAAASHWGEQAASLFFSAACRKALYIRRQKFLRYSRVAGKLPAIAG
jgi:hypothetical protein